MVKRHFNKGSCPRKKRKLIQPKVVPCFILNKTPRLYEKPDKVLCPIEAFTIKLMPKAMAHKAISNFRLLIKSGLIRVKTASVAQGFFGFFQDLLGVDVAEGDQVTDDDLLVGEFGLNFL